MAVAIVESIPESPIHVNSIISLQIKHLFFIGLIFSLNYAYILPGVNDNMVLGDKDSDFGRDYCSGSSKGSANYGQSQSDASSSSLNKIEQTGPLKRRARMLLSLLDRPRATAAYACISTIFSICLAGFPESSRLV